MPSILSDVKLAPGREERIIRRKLLPRVWPYPGYRPSISNIPLLLSSVTTRGLEGIIILYSGIIFSAKGGQVYKINNINDCKIRVRHSDQGNFLRFLVYLKLFPPYYQYRNLPILEDCNL